ncbi:MAG: 2-oxoacid:acceptor oxidoreductase family protein [Cocleimonas sp.]|nr:2-oxoacid:acceptor oxidoreductase family protein [Cocleimonas sp.]
MVSKPINLLIAGIGGQGINSLANVLTDYLLASDYPCQLTLHKGGAQSLGSVSAEFRISQKTLPTLAQGIPPAQLDILIALEPWEALRHLPLAHLNTQFWIETQAQALFVERSDLIPPSSPQQQLKTLPLSIHWQRYQHTARQQTGTSKMANYFAGIDTLTALNQAFQPQTPFEVSLFDTLFFKRIKKARKIQ